MVPTLHFSLSGLLDLDDFYWIVAFTFYLDLDFVQGHTVFYVYLCIYVCSFPIMLPLCNPVIPPLAVSCFINTAVIIKLFPDNFTPLTQMRPKLFHNILKLRGEMDHRPALSTKWLCGKIMAIMEFFINMFTLLLQKCGPAGGRVAGSSKRKGWGLDPPVT